MTDDVKKSQLMVRITRDQHKRLKFKALEEDRSVSDILRDLIDGCLSGEAPLSTPKPQPKQKREPKRKPTPEEKEREKEATNALILEMNQNGSLQTDIVKALNEKGYKTGHGGVWVDSSVRHRLKTFIG